MFLNYLRSRVPHTSYVVLRRTFINESTTSSFKHGNSRHPRKSGYKPRTKCTLSNTQDSIESTVHIRRDNHTASHDNGVDITEQQTSSECESPVSFTSRTHTCGCLRSEDVGTHVRLCGWVQSTHYKGKFVQLRDWDGWTQLMFTEDKEEMLKQVDSLKVESVIEVTGMVQEREKINKNIPTGDVEVVVDSITVLNRVPKDVPFMQKDFTLHNVQESLQMQYRYLALRYKTLQDNLRMRSRIIMKMREFLANKHNFVDVETPTLFRRTPGGAKEFVVPTQHPGKFYSLPQSPQQFKQLLMVGGIDRYFQVAKCYRDEGSRPDRQPEFTQLDLEMSFVTREGVIKLVEELLEHCWPEDRPNLVLPFPQITYQQAMRLYGSDKPDTRFDMKIESLSGDDENVTMGIKFQDTIKHISKTKLNSFLKSANYKPQARLQLHRWADIDKDDKATQEMMSQKWNCGKDDVIVTATGNEAACCELLGMLRLFIANELESKGQVVREPNSFNFLWVIDFPLFLPKEDGEGLESAHHPFTDVHLEDSHLLHSQPEKVRGQHYDLVLNGNEVGGGSIRIHDPDKQKYVLQDILKEDVGELDHLLKAFTMGCPPHGGIALGLDRLLACIMGTKSIRDVIAFPKSVEGRDVMSDAPAEITKEELERYHVSVVKKQT